MKSFNQIIFLMSYCVFSTVFAMEVEPSKEEKWVAVVNNNIVEGLVGGTVDYYDEYQATLHKNDQSNVTIFPIESTDPLPIEYCGNQRFFSTSALYFSDRTVPGQVYAIIDPAIKQLVVVRGNVQSNDDNIRTRRVHLYLGLETDRAELLDTNDKKFYPAKVMAFETRKQKKDTDGYCYRVKYIYKVVKPFDGIQLMEEVKKQNSQVEICDVTVPFLKPLVADLLGKNVKNFDFEKQEFNFTKRYWNKKHNALKGITYSSKDSKKQLYI